MYNIRLTLILAAVVLLVSTVPVIAQEHGEHGGGGCGDVFGDLIHILRDDVTGQPILAQRWIEMPAELPGYGWGYCVIPVDEDGQELRFTDLSCEVHEDDLEYVVETNYFGRLNGGRTKPRNNRMHFDEVISNIKAGESVTRGPAGRLKIGNGCEDLGSATCDEWFTVDSPMESMGLYVRLMKFGHIATDPYEIDIWAHGDPKLAPRFHPALSEEDFAKFRPNVKKLLPDDGADPSACWDYTDFEPFIDTDGDTFWDPPEPFIDIDGDGEWDSNEPFTDLDPLVFREGEDPEWVDGGVYVDGQWDAGESFFDDNENGVPDEFTFLCADQEEVEDNDFVSSAAFLSAAASKTGKITWDLVQYFDRFLKVTKKNPYTGPLPLNTLPALVRVFEIEEGWVGNPTAEDQVEPPYTESYEDIDATEVCADEDANCDLFVDVQELFVDFSKLDGYQREGEEIEAIKNTDVDAWTLADDVSLLNWVQLVNGYDPAKENIAGFVDAASDFLRMIEFIHNYDPPVDLYCTYETVECGVY